MKTVTVRRRRTVTPEHHDARVTLVAETSAPVAKPLGFTVYADWPRIEIQTGETKTVTVTTDGNL